MRNSPDPTPEAVATKTGLPPIRTITSQKLFDGAREIFIDHDGRLYRMRITQNGKLLLTT